MYHILILVISLGGQPVGIAKAPGNEVFADEASCTAAIPVKLVEAQKFLDENPTEEVRGKFAVAGGKCFSDAELDKLQHPKNQGA
jgi:hypothetical protein